MVPPVTPIQLPAPPTKPIQPNPMPQLDWFHFKPEFAGKPDKDVCSRAQSWVVQLASM